MKAAQYNGSRTIAVGESVAIPPGPGEVRLDVAFCGICGTDIHIFHGAMDQRVDMPQIIGHEVSATVADVGDDVTGVAVGDPVAVRPLEFGEPTGFDNGHKHVGRNLKFIGIDRPRWYAVVVDRSGLHIAQTSCFPVSTAWRDDRARSCGMSRCPAR